MTEAMQVVQALAVDGRLVALLKSLLDSPDFMHQTADSSYTHDNGFDKLLLASTPRGWRMRLHVWWPGRGVHTENIHNHRWDFASVLLGGSCRADYFSHDPGGTEMHAYEYVRGEGSAYRHHHLGTRRVIRAMSATMQQGDSYVLTRALMHRIVSDRTRLLASLMLHSPQRSESALTLTSAPAFQEPSRSPIRFTEAVLGKHLTTFLEQHLPA
ncbi:hypothetical protein [Streptomyces sp. H34-S4]|uniref:hypothetical protein n=1 Tax=Streptomyces sp. H34-S4 TaxID=2996463 RepID=UPI00226DFBD4|nr:hypothetical protein [Streptomyces sp. H34-S4]MCY0933933.1 hypothetical protein [Streptomyces sp. H34-S4]